MGTGPISRVKVRAYHQAKWDEPIVFELHEPGERGLVGPDLEDGIREACASMDEVLPQSLRRVVPPGLPEIAQIRVLRHYLRLSQQNLGADLNIEVGQGTCTMKYNPKINEYLANCEAVTELHPLQDDSTVQGMLQILYDFEQYLKSISGLDRFSLQPRSGSAAIYANASMIRAFHEHNREGEQRKEIITTIFSHPSNPATAGVAGFRIVTLYPDENGLPDLAELKSALSNRTAGFMVTNPEDTGIFNPRIREFTDAVHEAGGICCYDQANANGMLGITRAREAGFDLCQFNLHKTFAAPGNSGGPGAGVMGANRRMAPFLPIPLVDFDGKRYFFDRDRPNSIGKTSSFHGSPHVALKSYAWIRALGAEGLRQVAEIAVLNNNYLAKKIQEIPGVSLPYAIGRHRIEQARYSWEELVRETGVTSHDIGLRAVDYGAHYWGSHHPYLVPEPFTLEPTESFSQSDLDEYVQIMRRIAEEARTTPEIVRSAPHRSCIHRIDDTKLDDPTQWAMTWRAYLRKRRAT